LFELTLAAVEVGRPCHQALLQPLLDGSDGLSELDPGALSLALDRVAALFGEAPFLLAQLVARVGAFPGHHPLQLQDSPPRCLRRRRGGTPPVRPRSAPRPAAGGAARGWAGAARPPRRLPRQNLPPRVSARPCR